MPSPSDAPSNDGRRWPALALGAGGVVLSLALLSMGMAPTPCGDLAAGYPAIIAFELARDATDLQALFGSDALSGCRGLMVSDMDTANVVDLVAFMPAYGLFLWASLRMLIGGNKAMVTLATALVIAAVVSDAGENACLLLMTPALDPSSLPFALLPWVTGLKWSLLGAASTLAAVLLWRGSNPHKLGALLSLSAPTLVALALMSPRTFGPLVSLGITISWVVLLLAAGARLRQRPPAS